MIPADHMIVTIKDEFFEVRLHINLDRKVNTSGKKQLQQKVTEVYHNKRFSRYTYSWELDSKIKQIPLSRNWWIFKTEDFPISSVSSTWKRKGELVAQKSSKPVHRRSKQRARH